MKYKPTEYCLVCKNFYAAQKKCMIGWNTEFCNLKDFEPSLEITVYNLLILLNNEDVISGFVSDNIERWIKKKEYKKGKKR